MKQMSDSFDQMYTQYMQQEQATTERMIKMAEEAVRAVASGGGSAAGAGAEAGADAGAMVSAYENSASSQMDQISPNSYNLYNLPAGMPVQDLPVETSDDDNSQNE